MRIPAGFVPRRSKTRKRRRFVCQILSFAGIFLQSLAFVVGGRLPAAAPVAQRAGYFRVGGRPKVPLLFSCDLRCCSVRLKRPAWCWLACVGPESPSDRGHVIATIAAAVSMHPTLAKLDAMQIGAIELQNTRRAFRRLDTYLVLTRIVVGFHRSVDRSRYEAAVFCHRSYDEFAKNGS